LIARPLDAARRYTSAGVGRPRERRRPSGRPPSLRLDSAEPGIRGRCISREPVGMAQAPPGKSEPAVPGWCNPPSALLAFAPLGIPGARRLGSRPGATAAASDGGGTPLRDTCGWTGAVGRRERSRRRGSEKPKTSAQAPKSAWGDEAGAPRFRRRFAGALVFPRAEPRAPFDLAQGVVSLSNHGGRRLPAGRAQRRSAPASDPTSPRPRGFRAG